MAHDFKTRTIDYSEKEPPEWATPEEKVKFYPRRTAHIICEELRLAEEREAAQKKAEENNAANA